MSRVLAVALAALAMLGCPRGDEATATPAPAPTPTPPPQQQPQPQPQPDPDVPTVILQAADGAEHRVTVEVVRTPQARRRGLMYRQHLPVDHGMLFIFDVEEVQSFWMKNTLIPLDMLFINGDMEVVGIVENAEPRTLTSRSVGEPSIYVLEVNGGWSARHGVRAGARVRFENIEI